MQLAPRSLSPLCGGESEIEGLGERKPPKLQISQVRGSVPLALSLARIAQLRQNMTADIVEMLQDLVVPEAQDAEAFGTEEGVTIKVVEAVAVLAAVDLNDQPGFEADEIEDVAAQRYLSAEFGAGELAVAERAPEHGFGCGRVGVHLARPGSSKGFWFVAHGTGLLDWLSMRLWGVGTRGVVLTERVPSPTKSEV
ncbi:hypothetical protein BSY240_1409 [Agrobacterium sp. RAC06]|nr:hypothetical protein BSY240_1409 [Agrobacterium sp. RAC06]